jgi:hypothetical protein
VSYFIFLLRTHGYWCVHLVPSFSSRTQLDTSGPGWLVGSSILIFWHMSPHVFGPFFGSSCSFWWWTKIPWGTIWQSARERESRESVCARIRETVRWRVDNERRATTSDNERRQETTSDDKQQRATTSDNEQTKQQSTKVLGERGEWATDKERKTITQTVLRYQGTYLCSALALLLFGNLFFMTIARGR